MRLDSKLETPNDNNSWLKHNDKTMALQIWIFRPCAKAVQFSPRFVGGATDAHRRPADDFGSQSISEKKIKSIISTS